MSYSGAILERVDDQGGAIKNTMDQGTLGQVKELLLSFPLSPTSPPKSAFALTSKNSKTKGTKSAEASVSTNKNWGFGIFS